jgi:hypothetical protein
VNVVERMETAKDGSLIVEEEYAVLPKGELLRASAGDDAHRSFLVVDPLQRALDKFEPAMVEVIRQFFKLWIAGK